VDPDAGRLLLVALDDAGEVLGYSKSGEHKSRPAYASTCETSVYLAEHARRRGVGGALYDALLERLDESPLRLAVGGVAEPNEGSTRLHLSRGYERVGTFTGIGVKYAREWDVTWYQRRLATPRLVRELEGLVARGGGYGEGMAIVEARERPRGGTGERLILEWCAEVLAPVRPRDAGAA
jgi:L-amino acid N-acyltransferase YncA